LDDDMVLRPSQRAGVSGPFPGARHPLCSFLQPIASRPTQRGTAMKLRLKKLRDQVMVLTGASSGIGLVTARLAAREGARLGLAARSGEEVARLAEEVKARGGQAVAVPADVSNEGDVQRIADSAVQHFGGCDTWVNNAGVTVFGRLEEISTEDHRRL